MEHSFDIAIAGGGPIGASAAYFLAKQRDVKTILISREPTEEPSATYQSAGGSIRWYWNDPLKAEMTTTTAEFIKEKIKEGVPLSAIQNHYFFLNRGKFVPALNISGAELVKYFITKAVAGGVTYEGGTKLEAVRGREGGFALVTDRGEITAKKVLLALGPNIKKILPDAPVTFEKRQLFVLNLPVTEELAGMPHTILPWRGGVIFFFIKKVGDGYKLLFGQERIIKHNTRWEPENYFGELRDLGITKLIPFLDGTEVEKILWGFDAAHKTPVFYAPEENLFSVSCGSALRSCVYIGNKTAELLLKNTA